MGDEGVVGRVALELEVEGGGCGDGCELCLFEGLVVGFGEGGADVGEFEEGGVGEGF